jgi:hypothetical protein
MSLKELFFKWFYPNYYVWDVQITFEVLGEVSAKKGSFLGSFDLEVGSMQTASISTIVEFPDNIRIHVALVHYFYNGRMYTHVIDASSPLDWPPKKDSFCGVLPVKKALLYDEHGGVLMDVTEAVKRVSGPKSDFSFLKKLFRLEVTDILGKTVYSSILVAK